MIFSYYKKIIILPFLLILIIIGCKQNPKGYVIEGNITSSINIDTIFIYTDGYPKFGTIIAKAPVIDGQFSISGSIDTIQKVIIGNLSKNAGTEMILENDNFIFKVENDRISIEGGKGQELIYGYTKSKEYTDLIDDYYKKEDSLFKNIDENDKLEVVKARKIMNLEGRKIIDYDNKMTEKVINGDYPDVFKMIATINSKNVEKYSPKKRLEELDKYQEILGNHPNIRAYRDFLSEYTESSLMKESVKNGNSYKEMIGADVNGKEKSLSEYVKSNKYTLLEFWASWCAPCRKEIPNLKKVYKKYKPLGLAIYSISIDKNQEEWKAALKEEQTNWENVFVHNKESDKMVNAYGVDGIPASFLISQEGIIVASNNELRDANLEETLKKLFNKK